MPASPVFEYRRATPEDALSLGALATQVFFDTYATNGINTDLANEANDQYSKSVFAARLESVEIDITIAKAGGNLIGFVDVQMKGSCPVSAVVGPEILRLYVQRPFQRQGLGRTLLEMAEGNARLLGARYIWLTAWVENTRAIAFYPQLGYEKVGVTQYMLNGKEYENFVFAKALPSGGA